MKGGLRQIPMFKDTINTPYRSRQEQENEKIEKIEKNNQIKNYETINNIKNPPNTLFKLEINEPKMPKLNDEILPPYIFGQNTFIPTQFMNPNNRPMYSPMTNYPYIIKKNYINLNPVTDFTQAANIYEDILPNNLVIADSTFITLSERKNISDYVRGIFIKNGDGEEVLLDKLDKGIRNNHNLKNLLSRVKLLEINPYHFNKLTDNPYQTMPFNFCMYRSCYPIKLNEYNFINCAKSNIGMNVRIYGITENDKIINKNNGKEKMDSNLWRELEYYKLIKQNVIKQNMSPNFIQLYAYYRAKNIGINFKSFELLRKYMPKYLNDENNQNNQLKYQKLLTEILYNNDINTIKHKFNIKNDDDIINKILGNKQFNDITDDNIVMLTEAPTHNIMNWASKTYELNNTPIKKMLQSGYHTDKEWESILFQLFITQFILFKQKIAFNDFQLEYNVFIKDLQNEPGTNIGYWKYIVNNVGFKIPNYGYIVLIDSSYRETDNSKDKYKIYCTQWDDKLQIIIEKSLSNMLAVFNYDKFNSEFIKYGGTSPSDKIINLIQFIKNEIFHIQNGFKNKLKILLKTYNNNINLYNEKIDDFYKEIINALFNIIINVISEKDMFKYLHNRVGTYILPNEKNMLLKYSSAAINKMKKGELVAISNDDDNYQICIIIHIQYGDNECILLTINENNKIEQINVNINSLYFIVGNIDESYETNDNTSYIESYYI